jgi:hypothetical protein
MNQIEKEIEGFEQQMGLLKKMNRVLLVYAALITLLLIIHLAGLLALLAMFP